MLETRNLAIDNLSSIDLAPRSWSCLRLQSIFFHRLKLWIVKSQRILRFAQNCLPYLSFVWNFSYPCRANKEFISDKTLDLSLKSFMIPGPDVKLLMNVYLNMSKLYWNTTELKRFYIILEYKGSLKLNVLQEIHLLELVFR